MKCYYRKSLNLRRSSPPRRRYSYAIQVATAANFATSQLSPGGPSASLVLSVVIGLPAALWAYKCMMMVLFQRKIIYMGYAPPGAREERLGHDVPIPKNVYTEEITIPSEGKVLLSALVAQRSANSTPGCVIFYLQGNTGNPLHRLPVFSEILLTCKVISPTILAPAPRSYWRSTNRTPTERGILSDYKHSLHHAIQRWPGVPIILYGHSLGGAVAIRLLASLHSDDGKYDAITGLILENPFASVPAMVQALYPQRWLPYRYLGPFVWDKWDALAAMKEVQQEQRRRTVLARVAPHVLVLLSEHDEIVPREMGQALHAASKSDGQGGVAGVGESRPVVIQDALHDNAWMQRQWVTEMRAYLEKVVFRSGNKSSK
ncbi:alpha/beta-hydrolase [Rickenella mellea]|uniref:Alpha/beta-hydrolase n=1 Tax=Rickenella mellea TaxID=50990 RepID=A0A4Y7Q4V2_9AGAM|nr:alpha/beta-hydrolase [Rickenella mellea]